MTKRNVLLDRSHIEFLYTVLANDDSLVATNVREALEQAESPHPCGGKLKEVYEADDYGLIFNFITALQLSERDAQAVLTEGAGNRYSARYRVEVWEKADD